MEDHKDIVVVKYGSDSVANGAGTIHGRLRTYAEQLAAVSQNYSVAVVTSGAVAVGRTMMKSYGLRVGEQDKDRRQQLLASIGSAKTVEDWRVAFRPHGIAVSQLMVTHHEIDDSKEGGMLREVLPIIFNEGVIPIINANDVLSSREIRMLGEGGDNDVLASHIAIALQAKHLCLMTDKPGLLDKNRIVVTEINTENITMARRLAGPAASGTPGGMTTKIEAAFEAAQAGVTAHIAQANTHPGDVIAGHYGTNFAAQTD